MPVACASVWEASGHQARWSTRLALSFAGIQDGGVRMLRVCGKMGTQEPEMTARSLDFGQLSFADLMLRLPSRNP